jgi:effector-binding domain-containing protein
MLSTPQIENRPAHPYAAVRMQVAIPFGRFLQPAWTRVHKWLKAQGLTHGPAIIRYLTTDMSTKLDIEVGFVIDRPIQEGEGILTGVLPAGQYATLLYTGPYKGKGVYKANVAIMEWAAKNGVKWKTATINGVEWWESRVEWYPNDPASDPEPAKYQTELTFMVDEQGIRLSLD